MAEKAVDVDRESHERSGEPSSRATMRAPADERYTASQLLDHLDVLLAEDTLAALERVLDEREGDRPTPVILEK